MPFEVQHDWQASLATPRPLIGERAKIRLLLILCFLWISLGLIGHDPWKPDEAQSVSIIKHLMQGGNWAVPVMAGVPTLKYPPLYYLSASAGAAAFSPWLALHDAARLVSGLWMALTLLMVGMAGREMWGTGSGRQTTFVFLGSLGLLFPSHLLTPFVAGIAGYAMAFYGIALSQRRPWRAGVLIGAGIGIAFLSTGFLAAEIIALCAILLPLLFRAWRRKTTAASLATALITCLPWFAIWLLTVWHHAPQLLQTWLVYGPHAFDNHNIGYFLKTLTWFAWPSLPLALWTLWHYRDKLLLRPQFQLIITFFFASLILLGFGAESRDTQALPLLLPLALLGTSAIDALHRSLASLLDWFGIMLFGTMAFLIWLGWSAMALGFPTKLALRVHKLSPDYLPHFSPLSVAAACLLTIIWAVVVFRAKRSNRASVTDWAVGITMVWGLLMALWLPWLDAAKSYHATFTNLHQSLPASYGCVTSRNMGDAQRSLLDYYADIQAIPYETAQPINCDLYLIQDDRNNEKIDPGTPWKLIWQGKRAADKRESFRLFQWVR